MPGYSSMSEDVSSRAWNYRVEEFRGTAIELYSLKQKMLDHDALFRRQVSELHRLYQTQRDLMDEMKRSELDNCQRRDSARWHASVFPASDSWEKHGGSSGQRQPYFMSSVKSSQASNRPSITEKLNIKSGYTVGAPRLNELGHGSSSGSKQESICYPSVKFENPGSGGDGAGASGCSGNLMSLKSPNNIDLNCAQEMDLNVAAANDAAYDLKSESKRNIPIFDMNLLCEAETETEVPAAEKTAYTEVRGVKNLFDLNFCVAEDEASKKSGCRKISGIDLEAPAMIEVEEDVTRGEDCSQEAELQRVAAVAMVSFSSLNTASEALEWFTGVVCELERKFKAYPQPLNGAFPDRKELVMGTSCDKTDFFEHMTLELAEMSEEDCFPKSTFLPIPGVEAEPVNTFVGARPRPGQARPGRPKRDLQWDILPSLASLPSHQVTEDILAFDGLMKPHASSGK